MMTVTNSLPSLMVKEFLKLVRFEQNYEQQYNSTFLIHSVQ